MKFALLIHVLGMACLIGAIVPLRAIGAQFKQATAGRARAALVLTAIRMRFITAAILGIVVLTGAFMTMTGGYRWFDFGNTFWLAFKQLLGILLLGDALSALNKTRKFRAAILAAGENDQALRELLAAAPRNFARARITVGAGWLLAILGVLKLTL
ncbi:hypothetical protein HZB60_11895 [candidate division KSB1 bacterium]|nr:hypothetical protein [candidate division KSB1 bacterium]